MATGNDEKHKLEENLKAETSKEESQQKDNPPTAENPNSDPYNRRRTSLCYQFGRTKCQKTL